MCGGGKSGRMEGLKWKRDFDGIREKHDREQCERGGLQGGKETKRRRVQKFGSLDYGELRKGSDLITPSWGVAWEEYKCVKILKTSIWRGSGARGELLKIHPSLKYNMTLKMCIILELVTNASGKILPNV